MLSFRLPVISLATGNEGSLITRSRTQEIYAFVDEMTRFCNACLRVTSRIHPDCGTLKIQKLLMGAARDTFHRINKHSWKKCYYS